MTEIRIALLLMITLNGWSQSAQSRTDTTKDASWLVGLWRGTGKTNAGSGSWLPKSDLIFSCSDSLWLTLSTDKGILLHERLESESEFHHIGIDTVLLYFLGEETKWNTRELLIRKTGLDTLRLSLIYNRRPSGHNFIAEGVLKKVHQPEK